MVTAYLAAREGSRVTLIERSPRLGGLLACFPTSGDPLECYYHHFFTHDAEIRWLSEELGLSGRLRFENSSLGNFKNGRIFPFSRPQHLFSYSPLSLAGRLRFAASTAFLARKKNWREYEHVSTLDWFYRYAGREVTDCIWRPLLEIKFGRYADQVPLAWMIGRLRQRAGSRSGGKEKLGYMSGSLQVLVDALEERLTKLDVRILRGTTVKQVLVEGGVIGAVVLESGERLPARKVISTIPSPFLAKLLSGAEHSYVDSLCRCEYFGAICLILFLKRRLSPIYWLNVTDPGFPFGGVIEHTNFIPPDRYGGQHIAYLSRYFEPDNRLAFQEPQGVIEEWLTALPKIYPDFEQSWIRDVKFFRTAIAATVCPKGFSQIVPKVKTPIGGLFIANMEHIYPDERSCNNAIRVAANLATVLGIPHRVPANASLSGQVGFEAPRD